MSSSRSYEVVDLDTYQKRVYINFITSDQ